MYSIFCIEDSEEVQVLIRSSLGSHKLIFASSINEARTILEQGSFDAIILDIGLPDGDGLRFCSEIKTVNKMSTIPIFILTGKNSIGEKALGFNLGIEDFISKPFDPIELRLRVESRLQKVKLQIKQSDILEIGPLTINFSAQRVGINTPSGPLQIEFSATEFKILSFLAKNLDQVKTREQIIAAAWSDGLNLSDRTVDSHISRIRKKIKNDSCAIVSVSGFGYKLVIEAKNKAA